MDTPHPLRKHGAFFWDKLLLPQPLFEERCKRLQEAIVAAGDDGWILYGDADRSGDLVWLSHYLPPVRWGAAVVLRQGPPVLVAALDPEDASVAATQTWIAEVRPAGEFAAALAAVLNDRKLLGKRVGTVGVVDGVTARDWDALREQVPNVRFEQRDAAMRPLRPARQLAERNAVRRAGNVVERGFEIARHVFRAGVPMIQCTALIDRELRKGAAEDVRILVAAGEQTGNQLAPPDERVLRNGETVLLYVAAQVQRYWVEAAQTLVLGAIPPAVRELSNRAWRAVVQMEANARPGAKVADVAVAGRNAIGSGGTHWDTATRYGLGHGIGLDGEEPPFVSVDSTETIERETVLALRVVFHAGTLGAIAGGTYVIQPRESVPLVDHPPLVEYTS
jgi:Xaa-Pro aminopeptidase